jgi:hypothetical protein
MSTILDADDEFQFDVDSPNEPILSPDNVIMAASLLAPFVGYAYRGAVGAIAALCAILLLWAGFMIYFVLSFGR